MISVAGQADLSDCFHYSISFQCLLSRVIPESMERMLRWGNFERRLPPAHPARPPIALLCFRRVDPVQPDSYLRAIGVDGDGVPVSDFDDDTGKGTDWLFCCHLEGQGEDEPQEKRKSTTDHNYSFMHGNNSFTLTSSRFRSTPSRFIRSETSFSFAAFVCFVYLAVTLLPVL